MGLNPLLDSDKSGAPWAIPPTTRSQSDGLSIYGVRLKVVIFMFGIFWTMTEGKTKGHLAVGILTQVALVKSSI